jgi:hypothetical protein
LTSERKIKANRTNAGASTGPKTSRGRAASAKNALRHGLNLPVSSDPTLAAAVEALAREIAGPDANAEIRERACRVAEAQVDLRRVRYARNQFVSETLRNYELRPQTKANMPKDPQKFATTTTMWQKAKRLLTMDRYERRAMSRRNLAIRALEKARRKF